MFNRTLSLCLILGAVLVDACKSRDTTESLLAAGIDGSNLIIDCDARFQLKDAGNGEIQWQLAGSPSHSDVGIVTFLAKESPDRTGANQSLRDHPFWVIRAHSKSGARYLDLTAQYNARSELSPVLANIKLGFYPAYSGLSNQSLSGCRFNNTWLQAHKKSALVKATKEIFKCSKVKFATDYKSIAFETDEDESSWPTSFRLVVETADGAASIESIRAQVFETKELTDGDDRRAILHYAFNGFSSEKTTTHMIEPFGLSSGIEGSLLIPVNPKKNPWVVQHSYLGTFQDFDATDCALDLKTIERYTSIFFKDRGRLN